MQIENTLKKDDRSALTGLRKKVVKHWQLLLLMAPGLAFVIVFSYFPMYGIVLAFKDYDPWLGIMGSPWAGLKYFKMFLNNVELFKVLRNTLVISFTQLIFGFPAPIIMALMLNELRGSKFKRIVQTISYMPNFLSWVVVSGLMMTLLSPTQGLAGYIMRLSGVEPYNLLTSRTAFIPILVVSSIWKGVGWGTIVYLAALSGVDPQLYEAASMDGASRIKQIIHITLPALMPVISFFLVMSLSGLLNAGFDQIFNLYSPLVYEVADVLDTYVYRLGITSAQYELSTAIGLWKTVVAFILLMIANYGAKKLGEPGVW